MALSADARLVEGTADSAAAASSTVRVPEPTPGSLAGSLLDRPAHGRDTREGPSEASAVLGDGAEVRPDVSGFDQDLIERRNAVTGPITARLARRLKRALQDEHNDVLDRLRVGASSENRSGDKAAPGDAPGGELLPTRDEQECRYQEVALDSLREAIQAGVAFAGTAPPPAPTNADSPSPVSAPGSEPPSVARVEALAGALAMAIVEPLRRQLERTLVESSGEDQSVILDRAGAAYREWKGRRIEAQAGDTVVAAFSLGGLSAAMGGTMLRWLVHDQGGNCPDCDDNALAGPVRAGEPYPTGQVHPPAHGGCRCLLAPLSSSSKR